MLITSDDWMVWVPTNVVRSSWNKMRGWANKDATIRPYLSSFHLLTQHTVFNSSVCVSWTRRRRLADSWFGKECRLVCHSVNVFLVWCRITRIPASKVSQLHPKLITLSVRNCKAGRSNWFLPWESGGGEDRTTYLSIPAHAIAWVKLSGFLSVL